MLQKEILWVSFFQGSLKVHFDSLTQVENETSREKKYKLISILDRSYFYKNNTNVGFRLVELKSINNVSQEAIFE